MQEGYPTAAHVAMNHRRQDQLLDIEKTGFWVFAYGSLLWDAGFPISEKRRSVLHGYRRAFCMWSWHHRGTPEKPGLVLALDRCDDSSCEGLALRVAPGIAGPALEELRRRELVSFAYREIAVSAELETGSNVSAITYVIDRCHEQYCGDLPLDRQAEIIAAASGGRGQNSEYLAKTAEAISNLGIRDPDLEEVDRAVKLLHSKSIGANKQR